MRRPGAGWSTFRRIHLSALIGDRRRTLLSIIGVAVGVSVVLGTLVLKAELTRPFDAFGPALTHAAGSGVLLVMGGYGHSRRRELVMGGVTRFIAENTDVPVLMTH